MNNDGVIDHEEMGYMLANSGEEVTKEFIEDIFNVIDKDNSGQVTYAEFMEEIIKEMK